MENEKVTNSGNNKRQLVEQALQRVNEQVGVAFNSSNIKNYLNVSSNLHSYSVNNQLLVMMQKPDATDIAGFQQWKKEERSVKKGEKALQILAPTTYTKKVKQPLLNADGSKVTDAEGNVKYTYENKRMKGFTLVNVFDKSQTQGKEDERPIDILKNSQLGAVCLKEALAELSDIPIEAAKISDLDTYAVLNDDSITYNSNLEERRTISSIVDAYTKHIVDGLEREYSDEEKEILTDCIGYIINNHFGIDVSKYDFSDIDEYVENLAPTNSAGVALPKEARMKELLTEVQKQSTSIIKELTPKFNRNYVLDRALDIAEQTAYFMEAYDFNNIQDSVEGDNSVELHQNTVDEIYSEFLDLSKHDTILEYFDDFDDSDVGFEDEKDGIVGQIKFVLNLIKKYQDELGLKLQEETQEISEEDIPSEKLADGFEAVDTVTEEVPFDDIEDISVRVRAALQKTTNFRELAKLGPSDEVFPIILVENTVSFFDKENLDFFKDLVGENMVWEYIDSIPETVIFSEERLVSFLKDIKDIDLEALDNEFGHTLGLTQMYNKILNLADQYQMHIPSELLVERTKTVEEPTEEKAIEEPKSEEKAVEPTPELPKEEPSEEQKAEAPEKEKTKKSKKKAEETADSKKLQDFGEKIGGAKKDLWRARGLALSDLEEMNSAELDKYIKKDNVWIKPDYQKLVDDGLDVTVAYFYKQVRDSLPTRPFITSRMSDEEIAENQERYVTFVSEIRDSVYTCKTEESIKRFYEDTILGKGFLERSERGYSLSQTDKSKYLLENKQLKAMRVDAYDISKMKREIARKKFCYSEEQKLLSNYMIRPYSSSTHEFETDYNERTVIKAKVSGGTEFFYPKADEYKTPENFTDGTYYVVDKGRGFIGKNYESFEDAKKAALDHAKKLQEATPEIQKGRKKNLIPKQLEAVKRVGPSVREGDIVGEDYLTDFKIKGGEFGNWLNDKDRQASMNFGYEAFRDLATALNIPDSDIGLNGNLSIAFGARGSGSALAHYEPLREVINLTKMKGAGSLAHEYFHALDDRAGKTFGYRDFATNHGRDFHKETPDSVKKLVDALKYKTVTRPIAPDKKWIETLNKDIARAESNFMSYIKYYLPDSKLTEEQQKKRDELVQKALSATRDPGKVVGFKAVYESHEVNAISDYRKEILGHIIPAKERGEMAHNLSFRVNSKESLEEELAKEGSKQVETVKIKTQFYEDAVTIDNTFSRSGHGYWQSEIEMAARAFACYVDDKLKELGIRNDYLTGHAEVGSIPFPKEDGTVDIVRTFPVGEERKAINQAFDEMIKDFKKLGILHEKEVPKQIEKEKEVEKKQKQTKSKGPKL